MSQPSDDIELIDMDDECEYELVEEPDPIPLWWPISYGAIHGTTAIPFDNWLMWHADNAPALGHPGCHVRPIVVSYLAA